MLRLMVRSSIAYDHYSILMIFFLPIFLINFMHVVYAEQHTPLHARGGQPFQDPVILSSVPYMGPSYTEHPYQNTSLLGTGFAPMYLSPQAELMPSPPQLLPRMTAQGAMLSPNQPQFMGYSNENQPTNGSNGESLVHFYQESFSA